MLEQLLGDFTAGVSAFIEKADSVNADACRRVMELLWKDLLEDLEDGNYLLFENQLYRLAGFFDRNPEHTTDLSPVCSFFGIVGRYRAAVNIMLRGEITAMDEAACVIAGVPYEDPGEPEPRHIRRH